ncbi:phage tail protein, partial [Pseudomonas aeruginosa]
SATPPSEAAAPLPHLLVLQPLTANAQPFYFNLNTAAFDALQRNSAYNWSGQVRLGRRPALQSVGMGEESILLKGAVFPLRRQVGNQEKVVGLEQLEALRRLAERREPLILSSGYGEVQMGLWCLVRISENQSALLGNGAPRKQTFDLEFKRYGDDLPNR